MASYSHDEEKTCRDHLWPDTYCVLKPPFYWSSGNTFEYGRSETCKDLTAQYIMSCPKERHIYLAVKRNENKVKDICKVIDLLGKKYGIEQPYYAPLLLPSKERWYVIRIDKGWKKTPLMLHVVLSAFRAALRNVVGKRVDPVEFLCTKDKYCKNLNSEEKEKLFCNLPNEKSFLYANYGVKEWAARRASAGKY